VGNLVRGAAFGSLYLFKGVNRLSQQVTVNGFVIVANDGDYDKSSKAHLVFHPLYDGAYFLEGFDTIEEAESWCNGQNFEAWTEKLL
jgi:hypothetical protein